MQNVDRPDEPPTRRTFFMKLRPRGTGPLVLIPIAVMLAILVGFLVGKTVENTQWIKDTVTYDNRGIACFEKSLSHPGQILVTVFQYGCYSSSCTRQLESDGSARLDPAAKQIRLTSHMVIKYDTQRMCTADCGGGPRVQFEMPIPPDGAYQVWHGEKKIGDLLIKDASIPSLHTCLGEIPTPNPTYTYPPEYLSRTPENTLTPTETPIPGSWRTYRDSELGVSLRYPETWRAEAPNRYQGSDGFFEISAINYPPQVVGNLHILCILEANRHQTDLYGERPVIFDWQGLRPDSQDMTGSGCGILPSPSTATGVSALISRIRSDQASNQVMLLRTDPAHFISLVRTMRLEQFFTPTFLFRANTPLPCTLSAVGPDPIRTQVANLAITEYPIVDAECDPNTHLNGFVDAAYAQGKKNNLNMLNIGYRRRGLSPDPIQVGGQSIAWMVDQGQLFPTKLPSILNVYSGDRTLFSLSIPVDYSGASPVDAFSALDGHWVLELDNIVIQDGEIQNQKLGYAEMFGWHTVADQPFYLFRQGVTFGINYRGETLPKRYTDLIHGIDSGDKQILLPTNSPAGAKFFAQRDGVWWYVVIEAR